ncbi:ribonuclease H-like domain-containing protein [Tanacetum coccineum]
MHDPRDPHFTALKCILRYVRGTLDHGLQLHVSFASQLTAFTDADWVGCLVTRRSTSGYCVYLGDNLLSWSAKRQVTLSRSSAEAEYRGVANVVAKTAWIRNLLLELHALLTTATLVYYDNVSVVYLSTIPVQHQHTKHIEIDIHFVRDYVAFGQVRVLHVPSRFQYVDIFTKGLPSALFLEFRSSLNVRRSPVPTLREYYREKVGLSETANTPIPTPVAPAEVVLANVLATRARWGLRGSRKLECGALNLYVGNENRAAVEAIRSFDLILPNSLCIVLYNCHYAPSITNFNAIPRDDIFEIDMHGLVSNDSSMYNVEVDLQPNAKTVESKWLFKKKTDMDDNVHTYKARLVAKGYTQTSDIDYEETFSHVAEIKVIRILFAIAAFYDYEIWQMNVKTAFLIGHLTGEIYMVQPERIANPKYLK